MAKSKKRHCKHGKISRGKRKGQCRPQKKTSRKR